jgi:phenylpropionate dioxygenase-like ring-hydroxylating dioxygenase large terminal subunit
MLVIPAAGGLVSNVDATVVPATVDAISAVVVAGMVDDEVVDAALDAPVDTVGDDGAVGGGVVVDAPDPHEAAIRATPVAFITAARRIIISADRIDGRREVGVINMYRAVNTSTLHVRCEDSVSIRRAADPARTVVVTRDYCCDHAPPLGSVKPLVSAGSNANGRANLSNALGEHRRGHSLPSRLYTDPAVFAAEVEEIWLRRWVFAGHECELRFPGDFLTVQIGPASLIVLRSDDGAVRAFHNVCRHRGSVLCDAAAGSFGRRIVCPYHRWSYSFDGSLAGARATPDDFDPTEHGLATASCMTVAGLVYVCAASEPPDPAPYRDAVEPYLAPFDLTSASVAHTTTFVENGNWKLVMENNRECYHCRHAHPELCATFPEAPLHSGGGSEAELRRQSELVERAEALGLPSRFLSAADHEYRVMRTLLLPGALSMTLDGQPAVKRRFPSLPTGDLGDVLLYHYPSTWNHFTADHALTFRIVPLSPTTTELRTTWLVPGDSVEGVDYDLARLTEVWVATNAQDAELVERTQRGVSSPAYRPGPYSPTEEEGVLQFIEWYLTACGSGITLS